MSVNGSLNLGITAGSGTAADGFNIDGEEFQALARDNYAKGVAQAKETYAMNQAMERLNQSIKIGNKGASIATGAITG
ncbi:MAG: hypothetical protein HEQ39_13405 [Rhizobacter sp.]